MKEREIIFTRPHKTIYAEGDRIIKVFAKEGYKKSDVLNEARNEALVEESTQLNIPALLEVKEAEDGWCLVREKIEGKTLAQMMEEEPEKLESLMESFVDLQLKVHSQKAPTIKRLRHKLMDQINNVKDIDATTRYEMATRLSSMPKHTKLCHGDFNPSNVIVDSAGKYWIIDWAHAAQGNASADAAMTYLLFALEDQNKADLYMKLFCEKSDTARQYVNRWLPIVAAAQLTKKKELEKDFLMKWIDVVEYV